MFIRSDLLEEIGGFSNASDDIKTGYYLFFKGEQEQIIPVLNKVSCVETTTDLINQNVRIAMGALSFFEVFLRSDKTLSNGIRLLRLIWDALQEMLILTIFLLIICLNPITIIPISLLLILQLIFYQELYCLIGGRHKLQGFFSIVTCFFSPWMIKVFSFSKYVFGRNQDKLLMKSSKK